MVLTMTIVGPLGTVKVLSTPNDKIERRANELGISFDDYDTDLEREVAAIMAIVRNVKKPHIRAEEKRLKQELLQNPDISDLIEET